MEEGEKAPEGTAVAGGEDGGGFYNRRLHNFPLIKVWMEVVYQIISITDDRNRVSKL